MTSIYYGLIVFPAIFMILLAFVFQSSVKELKNQQYLMNCPTPVFVGNVTFGNPQIPDNNRLNYTIVNADVNEGDNTKGKYFDCFLNYNGVTQKHEPAVSVIGKNYELTVFNAINTGWYAWFGDTVYSYILKIQPFITSLYLFIQAPSIVTNLAWFSYVNIFFSFLIGLGIFMAIRGSS